MHIIEEDVQKKCFHCVLFYTTLEVIRFAMLLKCERLESCLGLWDNLFKKALTEVSEEVELLTTK